MGAPVSIAMATFNGARHIREQLDDLARQTHPPAELVVCDDGSTDDTVALIERFAATAPFPVHVVRNPRRLGYRENFFRCTTRCTSELIAFCDQDDRWHPQKLEIAAAEFDADGELLVLHHNAGIFSEARGRFDTLHPRDLGRSLTPPLGSQPWAFSTGLTQLFRRPLLAFSDLWELSEDEGHEGERLAHDQWFHFLASVLGRILYLPDELADYRQHERNVFGWGQGRPRPAGRIAYLLRLGAADYDRFARSAAARALILEKVAERTQGAWRDRAHAGAKAYRSCAARHAARAALYRARNPAARARAFRALLALNAYARAPWYFEGIDLAKDMTLGLSGLRLPPAARNRPRRAAQGTLSRPAAPTE